jgi:hypothetical protein
MIVIGQAPPAVFPDVCTRAERNQARYLAWLRRHPGAAEDLTAILAELGTAAFERASMDMWNEAQVDVWH